MTTAPLAATDILPSGRSFAEYCLMFGLSGAVAPGTILGVGDGLSNFNAEATRRGWHATSVDPLYRLPAAELEQQYRRGLDATVARLAQQPEHWIWTCFDSVDALRSHRQTTLRDFIDDFGIRSGRYIAAGLPSLPFGDDRFDVAVCSHLLFTWSTVLDLEFHRRALTEMLRVAREVRVFPTNAGLKRHRSSHLDVVMKEFEQRGCAVRLEPCGGLANHEQRERLIIGRPAAHAAAVSDQTRGTW
jgi:hypothetical protein